MKPTIAICFHCGKVIASNQIVINLSGETVHASCQDLYEQEQLDISNSFDLMQQTKEDKI